MHGSRHDSRRRSRGFAIAADAVARGDLDHRVEGHGAGEVGRLAAAFNSMTESLRRTLGELSKRQALAAVGEFAASLSHEVRNGLTAVRVDLQRAEEKTAEGAASRSLIARALENVKRLDGTVSGSMRVARSGQSPRRRLDLGSVAAAAAQSADSTFMEHGATLDPMASSSTSAWVLGDPIALEQLLLNLLRNSAQAMGPGGRASLTVAIDGSDVRIVVSDRSPGSRRTISSTCSIRFSRRKPMAPDSDCRSPVRLRRRTADRSRLKACPEMGRGLR